MGNRLSLKGSAGKKKNRVKRSRHKRLEDSNAINEWKGGLEIEEICEVDELDSTSAEYLNKNQNCEKAPRHEDYINFKDLTLDTLPESIRHPAVFDYIRATGNLVVCIYVEEKSPDREKAEDSNYGHAASGYACVGAGEIETLDCPDPNCSLGDPNEESHTVYGGILVTTNRHVILDDFECENSTFYFFYENGSMNNAKVKGHGFCVRDNSSENKDYVGVNVYFHDAADVEQIRKFSSEADQACQDIPYEIQTAFKRHTVAISHPHSWPKQVSFGELLEKEQPLDENQNEEDKRVSDKDNNTNKTDDSGLDGGVRDKQKTGRRVTKYTSMTCKGSSGCPVLSGFYWGNPFVHSSGFWSGKKEEGGLKIFGESYIY